MTSVIEQTGVSPSTSGDRAPLSSVVAEITNNPMHAPVARSTGSAGPC